MFEVTALRRVEIEIHGEKLAHYFKELFTADYLALQRRLQESNGDTLAGVLATYDARCVKIEGDEIMGDEPDTSAPRDLMQARPDDWRSLVPPDHKVSAWVKLNNGESVAIAGATILTAQPEPSDGG